MNLRLPSRVKEWLTHEALWLNLAAVMLGAYAFMRMGGIAQWGAYLRLAAGMALLLTPLTLLSLWKHDIRLGKRAVPVWLLSFFYFGAAVSSMIAFGFGVNDLMGSHPVLRAESFENRYGLSIWLTGLGGLWGSASIFRWLRGGPRQVPQLPNWNPWIVGIWIVGLGCSMILWASTAFQDTVKLQGFWGTMGYFLSGLAQLFAVYFPYYLLYFIHHKWLFNRFLRYGGLLKYLSGIFVVLLVASPLFASWAAVFPAIHTYLLHPAAVVPAPFNEVHFILPNFVLLVSLPFIVGIEWMKQRNALQQLAIEKKQAELSLLKQQINPHFFFNTLNNLYAMSLTQARETPETILKLAELMRYVIYKGQLEEVELGEDWQYIKDYLALQEIRLKESLDLVIVEELENTQFALPPLLLIMLVENAFKHGVEPADEKASLHIRIQQSGSKLDFSIQNSLPSSSPEADAGIGLENLQRRLDLRFPNRYSLEFNQSETHFTAHLILKI